MSEPELLLRECELLGAFRQAAGVRLATEADAEARLKGQRESADSLLHGIRREAEAHLTKAIGAREEARRLLTDHDLQEWMNDLPQSATLPRETGDPERGLAASSAAAVATGSAIAAVVEELETFVSEQWVLKRARRAFLGWSLVSLGGTLGILGIMAAGARTPGVWPWSSFILGASAALAGLVVLILVPAAERSDSESDA